MGRIHIHLESVPIGLQQLLVALGELVGVLAHVGRGDGVQRLVVGVRIGVMLARTEVREAGLCGRGEAAVPGGDGAVGVARLLRAQWRELGAELRGVGGGHGRHAPARPT